MLLIVVFFKKPPLPHSLCFLCLFAHPPLAVLPPPPKKTLRASLLWGTFDFCLPLWRLAAADSDADITDKNTPHAPACAQTFFVGMLNSPSRELKGYSKHVFDYENVGRVVHSAGTVLNRQQRQVKHTSKKSRVRIKKAILCVCTRPAAQKVSARRPQNREAPPK